MDEKIKKIIILFGGNATNLENILKTMHNKNIQVVATFTNNKNARGINISKHHNVDCFLIDEEIFKDKASYNNNLLEGIQKIDFDLMVLAGYMKILPSSIIDSIKQAIINIHPSLLPLHKGLNGAKKSYEDDNQYGGVSVHFVSAKVDSGEMILQQHIDKTNINTLSTYEKELSKCEFEILPLSICKVLNIPI